MADAAGGTAAPPASVTPLHQHLIERIRRDGPLTVADYMAEALGHPQYGYYTTRDPFGSRGDFTTAPEISQMFGEIIGLWLAEAWRLRKKPERFILLELGPGRGTLMADLLRAARGMPGFMRAAEVHLVETSPILRQIQKRTLQRHSVIWHESLDTVPDNGPLYALANEFFDALPIQQFVKTRNGWRERLVDVGEEGELVWGAGKPLIDACHPGSGKAAVRDLPLRTPQQMTGGPGASHRSARDGEVRRGDILELCPIAQSIARDLGQRIKTHDGVGLFIDYGYTQSACGETLQAVRSHKPVPILESPGEADLTAHVDFAALADGFRAGGAVPASLETQGTFLSRLGIMLRAQTLSQKAPPDQHLAIHAALHRLTASEAMGSLFKVLKVGAEKSSPFP